MMQEFKVAVGDVVVWCMNQDLRNFHLNYSPDETAWGIGIVASIGRLDHMNPVEVWTIHSYLMEFGHMNHGFFREESLSIISKRDFWPTHSDTRKHCAQCNLTKS